VRKTLEEKGKGTIRKDIGRDIKRKLSIK